jgi:inhibitor of cysteine peptidase
MFKIENDRITMKKDDKHKSNVLRSLYISNYIYTFSNDEIHIIDENNWKTVKIINLRDYTPTPTNPNENALVKHIKVGEKFNISLKENPTTGYIWSYTIDNNKIVKITSDNYSTTNNGIGSGGTHYWTVVGLKRGSATIVFNYKRAWESNNTIKTVKYEINVE